MKTNALWMLFAAALLASCASGTMGDVDGGGLIDDTGPRADGPARVDGKIGKKDVGAKDKSVGPKPDTFKPKPDTFKPKPDTFKPKPDTFKPKPDTFKPKPDTGPLILTAPFSFNFESNNGGMVATRDWQWGKIAFNAGPGCSGSVSPPPAGHSGVRAWGTILNDCYNPHGNGAVACANQNKNDDSILKLTFAIPGWFKDAYLIYWEWNDYFLSYDWSEVYVNGQVIYQICSGSYVKPTGWVKRTLSLKQWIGKTATLEFHFMASSVVNYAGWYLDDLSVVQFP